ncbi:MAG: helix-turn-helix domain-containing protein [Luteolibacter sp.]
MHSDHQPVPPDTGDVSECPIRNVLDRIGDQWSLLVILTLGHGTHRFTELQRAIGDISKRMLSNTLRKLERDGFVSRKVYPTVPPKVEYRLLPLGESLAAQLEPLIEWANKNHDAVREARRIYQAPARSEAL